MLLVMKKKKEDPGNKDEGKTKMPSLLDLHEIELAGLMEMIAMSEEICILFEVDLDARDLVDEWRDEILLEPFPGVPVEVVAELAVVVHLAPAVTAPLTAGHVNEKVAVSLVVVEARVEGLLLVRAGTRGETVDESLRHEARMAPDPGLGLVQLLQGVLFLMRPVHVFLLVHNGVPPHVQELVRPGAPPHEERAEVEARAVLGKDKVHGVDVPVPYGTLRVGVQIARLYRMGNVEGIVFVDIAIDVLF